MAFLDHIARCNQHDPSRYRPFLVNGRAVGRVRHDTAALLAEFSDTVQVTPGAVILPPDLEDPQGALDRMCRVLSARGQAPALRGERYKLAVNWHDPAPLTLDRGMVSLFGVGAFGVHVNGFVRDGDGLKLWIGKRAADKALAPGKLDNVVAGGQPAHLSLMDNLVKEAAEEADIPEALARTARPVGAISYVAEDRWGLKPDLMFCFDLELPKGFVPRNTDGEVESFTLMGVDEVTERMRTTDDFKSNVNLVILDFLIRHGLLTPDDEPDYAAIVHGLKRGR